MIDYGAFRAVVWSDLCHKYPNEPLIPLITMLDDAISIEQTQKPVPALSPVVYRHPHDPTLTWCGRGRRPTWLRQLVENGRNADEFRVRGAASCFFPVAARELVKDGLSGDTIAAFCVEGALEALTTSGLSREDAENKLMQIVLSYRITEEISDRAT